MDRSTCLYSLDIQSDVYEKNDVQINVFGNNDLELSKLKLEKAFILLLAGGGGVFAIGMGFPLTIACCRVA